MSPKDLLSKKIRQEWRNLGFYYEYDGKKASWRFIGSKEGLIKFCARLEDYIKKPKNASLSEHDHFGPYMYLKITTFNEPMITDDGIYGTLEDIKRLSNMIKAKLSLAKIYEKILIDSEYSNKNKARIEFFIKEEDFDPVSADPQLQ